MTHTPMETAIGLGADAVIAKTEEMNPGKGLHRVAANRCAWAVLEAVRYEGLVAEHAMMKDALVRIGIQCGYVAQPPEQTEAACYRIASETLAKLGPPPPNKEKVP